MWDSEQNQDGFRGQGLEVTQNEGKAKGRPLPAPTLKLSKSIAQLSDIQVLEQWFVEGGCAWRNSTFPEKTNANAVMRPFGKEATMEN